MKLKQLTLVGINKECPELHESLPTFSVDQLVVFQCDNLKHSLQFRVERIKQEKCWNCVTARRIAITKSMKVARHLYHNNHHIEGNCAREVSIIAQENMQSIWTDKLKSFKQPSIAG